ncbi:MAG: D-isomer specific 2-hydroxyacid dehydrogenase family protein [Patescibacteria group bacterium]
MKFKKILLLNYTGKELEKIYWDRVDKLGDEKIILVADDSTLPLQLKNTDCLLVKLGAKVGKEIIDKAPKLKYIGMLGTGVGGVDLKCATKKKIAVCNIADYATEGVAEFTFGTIIDYLRELERAKQQARKADYSEATFFTGTEIKNKNFGVIGLGHIGARVAEIAKGFGAKVSYWSQNRKKNYEKMGIKYKNINDLLESSDIITLNLSLNPQTNNFLNKERVKLIKKGALLINTSPMELIDLKALAMRLKNKDLSFILDHSDEMTKEQLDLVKPYKNCVIYPPLGYTTQEATALKKGIFVGNLENFLKGKPTNRVS